MSNAKNLRYSIYELAKAISPDVLDKKTLAEIDPMSFGGSDDPRLIWPSVPYHYGMGRIREYELWRDSLSEEGKMTEIASCIARYEQHYDIVTEEYVRRMKAKGKDHTAVWERVKKELGIHRPMHNPAMRRERSLER